MREREDLNRARKSGCLDQIQVGASEDWNLHDSPKLFREMIPALLSRQVGVKAKSASKSFLVYREQDTGCSDWLDRDDAMERLGWTG